MLAQTAQTAQTARAAAAERNTETAMVKFDIDDYTKASPETKEALLALQNVAVGACHCGNQHPTKRWVGCGVHLSCEACADDRSKVLNRRGDGCIVAGCYEPVCFPCVAVPAFDAVQSDAVDAIVKMKRALELNELRDEGEGARRRAEALGRAEPEPNNKRARLSDIEDPEEREAERSRRAGMRAACAEKKRHLENYAGIEAVTFPNVTAADIMLKPGSSHLIGNDAPDAESGAESGAESDAE